MRNIDGLILCRAVTNWKGRSGFVWDFLTICGAFWGTELS